jgi:hypothetical protein
MGAIKKPGNLPRAFAGVNRALNPMAEVFNRGILVSSDTIISEPLPDGRVRAHLNPTAGASLLLPPAPTPGTYVLGSIDSVIQWISTEECECGSGGGIDGGGAF